MHEDLIKEINEDKKMGLDLSDTAFYNVNDGVTDEPLAGDEPEKPEPWASDLVHSGCYGMLWGDPAVHAGA